MKGKILNKIIAILTVIVLTVSYWSMLGKAVYAIAENIEEQKARTNNKNVEFDAYFKTSEKTYSQTILQNVEGKLYVNINVKEGYLKEGTINIDNPNFKMNENPIKVESVEGQQEIEIPFTFEKKEEIDIDYLSKDNNVEFKGIYVDKNSKEKEVTGNITVHLTWTEDVIGIVEQNVEKVIDLGEGRTLVQVSVKDYIKDNAVPAESVSLETDAIKIENAEIESVEVYATKTIVSNGNENGTSFTRENWEYNQEEGKIKINIENQKTEDGKIAWKDGEDEFKIIYIIKSQNAIENAVVGLHTEGEIKYNDNIAKLEESKEAVLAMTGTLISFEYGVTGESYKGYIYSKSEDTEYTTTVSTEISYNDMIDYINIKMNTDSFIDIEGNVVETNEAIYKRTKINKDNFVTLFGEEGKLEIYGNGNKIAEITKDSNIDENGNIVIEYERNIINVEIVSTKPISNGKLIIENTKAVKAENEYETSEIKSFAEVATSVDIVTNRTNETKTANMKLLDTITKSEITMLTDKVSTVINNESVEIKILFRTDSNMYDLYKNPYLEIELPNEVKDVEIESIQAAFADGFTLKSYDVITNDAGNKVIRIALNGEQTRYALDISEGTTLIVKTKITMDKKTGSKEDVVKLKYVNENAMAYDNEGIAEGVFRIEAPTGIVAINTISNYNDKGESVTSLSSKEQVGELEILTDKKKATVAIDVINNHDAEIKNPVILGRLPVEGNKKMNGEELGSTFTSALVNGIEKIEGLEDTNYKIYYSENIEATENIESEENNWTEDVGQLEEPKSYMIAIEDYSMGQGEVMSFKYDVEIPENLNHNESSYTTYLVNYQVEEEGMLRNETITAPTVGTTTGAGPVLDVKLEASVENGAEVEEGQIVKYNVIVKNIGDVDAKNVKVIGKIPENAVYVKQMSQDEYDGAIPFYSKYPEIKEYVETIETIKKGETYIVSYEVEVGTILVEYLENGGTVLLNSIETKAIITADDLGKNIETEEYKNKIVKVEVQLSLNATFGYNVILKEGDFIDFSGTVTNSSDENKDNINVVYNIPEGFKIEEVKLYIAKQDIQDISNKVSMSDGKVNFDIGTLEAYSSASISIRVKIDKFKENEYEKTMKSKLELNGMYSNEIENRAAAPKIEVNYTSNSDKYVGTNSKLEYYIEIANSGKVAATNVKLEDKLPEELKFMECSIVSKNNNEIFYSINQIGFDIPAEDSVMVTLVANVKDTAEDGKEITNAPIIKGDNIATQTLNPITHIITTNKSFKDPNTGELKTTYSVSGTAWKDSNKNGKKDSDESKLSNIEVILIDNKTGEVARNPLNAELKTRTNSNGEYKFDGVVNGEYLVIFLYESGKYTITESKKAGVLESENSDAVKANIKLDGESKEAGVTSIFEINDRSVSGINIGLIEMDKAVFSINKVVTKMTMQNPKTSKTVNFNNSKLAKMDADWKYMNSTTFVIEYKMIVTNEGSVPGYVSKIVDYVPSQLKFSTDLNKTWYSGNDGAVYNTSLSKTVINPGESKEVSLVLTKIMNETGDGIFHNTAEITEMYNEHGLANVAKKDNTKQSADVMIGVKTGGTVMYVSLIFIIIAFIGTGVYFINKKVFNKVIDKKLGNLKDYEE